MALPPSIFDALREFSRIQYKTKLFETLNNEKLQERVKIGSVITTRPVIAQNRPYGSNEAGIPGLVTPFDIQRQANNPANYIPEAPIVIAHQFIPAAVGGSTPPIPTPPTPPVTGCNVSLTAITGVGNISAFPNISGGGDTFDCYNSGVDLNGLNYGTYFADAWVSEPSYIGMVSYDSFDTYVAGLSVLSGTLSAGFGFTTVWSYK